jgi:hypothetical protein
MHGQPQRGRPWRSTNRTGGPLDDLLDELRHQHPNLVVERLGKTHPADDDNVYFLRLASGDIVQVDTGPDGQPPFTIEAENRIDTPQVTEALAAIQAWFTGTH